MLKDGMVFTVELMITERYQVCYKWNSDGWTCFTDDGEGVLYLTLKSILYFCRTPLLISLKYFTVPIFMVFNLFLNQSYFL